MIDVAVAPSQEEGAPRATGRFLITIYPWAVAAIGLVINLFAFGVVPAEIGLPTRSVLAALVAASLLLVFNHSWLMTATELTRARFRLVTTPEEWAASGRRREDASRKGLVELERCHNAHRNTTENTVYFALLGLALVVASPASAAAVVWLVGFALARLGYTYSYLTGKDGSRGVFMTLSLMALYGMGSYLLVSLLR